MYNVFPNLQQVFNSFIMGNNDQHNLQKNLCSSSCSIGARIIFLALCCSSVEDGSTTWAASSATMYDSLRMAAIDARNDAELPAEVCQRYIRSGQSVTFNSFYLDQAWSILPTSELPPLDFSRHSRDWATQMLTKLDLVFIHVVYGFSQSILPTMVTWFHETGSATIGNGLGSCVDI